MYQHLGIKLVFYSDDPETNHNEDIIKIRDLTARYALFKMFNKALDVDIPDSNDLVS